MSEPHVQLILDNKQVPPTLQTALNRLRARVSIRSVDKALNAGVSQSADVCVILPSDDDESNTLNRILDRISEQACATMVLPSNDNQLTTTTRLDHDSVNIDGRGMNADELTGRIKALCDIRRPLQKMQEELTALKHRDAALTLDLEHFTQQLEIAGQIQRDLLPPLPTETAPIKVSTLYLPADQVSGDLYDVSTLNTDQFAVSLADATGHGLPAALLTLFMKNAFEINPKQQKSIYGHAPKDTLTRLNTELCGAELTQCQFITALHGVVDRTACEFQWARAGAPYPVLIRKGEQPRQLTSEGSLLGAYLENTFELASHSFKSGDTLLLHTDGLDALMLDETRSHGSDGILKTRWMKTLAEDGVDAAFKAIRHRAERLSPNDWNLDDITVIALQMP